MAVNAIALAELWKAALDRIYIANALTVDLEGNNGFIQSTDDAKTIKIARMQLQGLGDYSRSQGYVMGDVTLEWDPYVLTHDRGRKFQVDAMDDREALYLPLLNLVNMFMTEYVVPEIDAIRFATMASRSLNNIAADLADADAVIAAWDEARKTMDKAEVPQENRRAYFSVDVYHMLARDKVHRERLTPAQSSDSNFERLDNIPVRVVPPRRFYSAITLRSGGTGEEAGGYVKGASGKDINFQLVHTPAVAAVTKHAIPRIFGPTVNQAANATAFDYRIYHDLIVPNNRTVGVYTHTAA